MKNNFDKDTYFDVTFMLNINGIDREVTAKNVSVGADIWAMETRPDNFHYDVDAFTYITPEINKTPVPLEPPDSVMLQNESTVQAAIWNKMQDLKGVVKDAM